MSTQNLDRLLSAAKEFDGSDLHLVAGVPPPSASTAKSSLPTKTP